MIMKTDKKVTPCDGETANFKMAAMPSSTNKTTEKTSDSNIVPINNKRLESMTDDETIQRNLKELMDKKNREERKANGRLVAVILASLVIFLAIYHAWIRKSGILAGVLVPAVIMLSFGAWVVILAKRDKAKRQVFEKYLEEVAAKNKQELEAKSKTATKKSHNKKNSSDILLHYENEINTEQLPLTHKATTGVTVKNNNHRKHRKHRNGRSSDDYSTSSSTSSKKSSHYATKDLRIKRPSIRQKLFRQTGISHMPGVTATNATHTLVQAVINTPVSQCEPPLSVILSHQRRPGTLVETKHKRLQRLNALPVPTMVRMGSAP